MNCIYLFTQIHKFCSVNSPHLTTSFFHLQLNEVCVYFGNCCYKYDKMVGMWL